MLPKVWTALALQEAPQNVSLLPEMPLHAGDISKAAGNISVCSHQAPCDNDGFSSFWNEESCLPGCIPKLHFFHATGGITSGRNVNMLLQALQLSLMNL